MNYKNLRDTAWRILIKNRVSSLPVSVEKICRGEHVRLISYQKGARLIRRLELEENLVGNDAFSFGRVIFYDSDKPLMRQRFSIAHELGHIVLHGASDEWDEREADRFASRLLAPLCVLHYLDVESAEEISDLCAISISAARIRFERLCEIRERDNYMRERAGRGCFLISPLERKVCRNFKKYIEKNKG